MNSAKDVVGLGWRPDLASSILDHLGEIDLLEVIADDFYDAPRRKIRALKTLASQIPVVLHGVGMGLASAARAEKRRLQQMASLVDFIAPQFWSEHLAFVRAGGVEIGHLAAPPRTTATIEGTSENLYQATRIVGTQPRVENIATLVDPPGSVFSESKWVTGIVESSGCGLLLDLHNIYANGLNHGYDPREFLEQIPASSIAAIHIAGGKSISGPDGRVRILDDHLHDVPDPVFDLLEQVAALAPHPLTVILERDGDYPSMNRLLAQISGAREAMARGRAHRQIASRGAVA
ncbi:MAG TPA: DUF692 domain-containing protein [Candidatus Saccharimonadales bacterium]|nr:DUF692 domain-containing protein [Candidatus Saccharimonadales bacterium]